MVAWSWQLSPLWIWISLQGRRMLDQVFLQGRLVFCCLMFPAVLYSHAGLFFFFFFLELFIYLLHLYKPLCFFLPKQTRNPSLCNLFFFFPLVKHKIIKSLQHLIHNQHRETNKTTEVKKNFLNHDYTIPTASAVLAETIKKP